MGTPDVRGEFPALWLEGEARGLWTVADLRWSPTYRAGHSAPAGFCFLHSVMPPWVEAAVRPCVHCLAWRVVPLGCLSAQWGGEATHVSESHVNSASHGDHRSLKKGTPGLFGMSSVGLVREWESCGRGVWAGQAAPGGSVTSAPAEPANSRKGCETRIRGGSLALRPLDRESHS